ncbi:WD domain, G-beta repeat protein, partial [Ancylostoma caninum]
MGGWFSSFLTLKSFLYKPKHLSISAVADPSPDPFVLLSAAAEIAALHRRMEDTVNANQQSASYDDTDVEDSVSSLLREEKEETSSDEDESSDDSCVRISDRQQRELFEKQRKMAFRGRMLVGNPQVKVKDSFTFSTFFICTDERIRFFQQCGPRDRYLLKDTIHVPITSWSILDVAMNRRGDALCYGTWKDSVFYARLHEPTFDNPTGISWTELAIPNQDASMAVFSLRFSRQGHEILCGGSDRCLHVFDLESMSRIVTIPDAHGDDINAVCYGDTESHLLYSGGDDGLVKVYDRRAF